MSYQSGQGNGWDYHGQGPYPGPRRLGPRRSASVRSAPTGHPGPGPDSAVTTATDRHTAGPEPGPPANTSGLGYLPGLDGLRAIAVVAVMIYHANHTWLEGGYLGVEVFFVISGYLITMLLIREKETKGRISLGGFWLRRAKRLLPALFAMLTGLGLYMAASQHLSRGRTRGDFVAGLTYVSNWYQIYVGQGYGAKTAFVPLRHLWSLAVEEQYYLLWPLVMVAVLAGGRKRLFKAARVFFGVAVLVTLVMAVLFQSGDIDNIEQCAVHAEGYWQMFGRCISANDALYLSTITRSGGLLLGAFFAVFWRPYTIIRGPLRSKAPILDGIALVGVAGLILSFVFMWLQQPGEQWGQVFNPVLFRGGMFLIGILTLMVVAAVTHPATLTTKALGNPVLTWVGTRSYGLYLYHWPLYQIIRQEAGVQLTLWQFVLAMALTVVISELSYRFLEMPIRRGAIGHFMHSIRGGRFQPVSLAPAGLAVLAMLVVAVNIGVAANTCGNTVECATSVAAPPDTTPTAAPATTFSAGPTTTLAPGATTALATNQKPYAVGESLMFEAQAPLRKRGFRVDGEKSRAPKQIIEVLEKLKAKNEIPSRLVLQVGTNGIVTEADWDKMLSYAPEGTTVYVLTVRNPGAKFVDPNNERIRDLPSRKNNVKVIDWNKESDKVKASLCHDGVHLSCHKEAMNFFIDLLAKSVGIP